MPRPALPKTVIQMKAILSTALALSFYTSTYAINYINNGTSQVYSLLNGDTLRIARNTFTGIINVFPANAVIVVVSGAVFQPADMGGLYNPAGKIINHGAMRFTNASLSGGGFALNNFGLMTVTGNVDLTNDTRKVWTNHVAATININGNLTMTANAELNNYAGLYVSGSVNMSSSSVQMNNMGLLRAGANVSVSDGVFNNLNRLDATNINISGGQFNNTGGINLNGAIALSGGINNANNCVLITQTGFTNSTAYTNNGLLWVGRTGTAADYFSNSGTFTGTAGSAVRTVRFTNNATINGSSRLYIEGESGTSGPIGRSGNTSDSIIVYDVTRTNPTLILDVQSAAVRNNVVYRPFARPDTNAINYTGCSSYFRSNLSVLLPIEWRYFDLKAANSQAVISWGAANDAAVSYAVERSYDNSRFVTIGTVAANNTKNYTYTDASVRRNTIVYYRVKAVTGGNQVRYTETKMLRTDASSTSKASIAIHPNPVKSAATISFTVSNAGNVKVMVKNITGQALLSKTVNTIKGINHIDMTELTSLKAGMYFLEITDGATTTSERFIKQ